MAQHHIVEHRDANLGEHYIVEHRDSGSGTGVVLGIGFLLIVVAVALFFVLGGPTRLISSPVAPPNQTNINVPRQIDININPGQQAPSNQPAPSNQQPGQRAPSNANPQPDQQAPAPAGTNR